jgi:N-acetylglucosaminyldiphosphoundecaprenol N-acetyl-beta-D-mannosaminyltransferase
MDKLIGKVDVLGCPITNLSLDDFVNRAEQFISSKTSHYIAMMNVAKLIKMRSDEELAQSILTADLIGADGVPLVWASRLLGRSLPGRVNGTDLMYKLLEKGNEKGYRIFFFGADEDVLERILRKVRVEYPGINIAGFHHGYFDATEELKVAHEIRQSQADILFIAFGSPKKELWVKQYFHVMGVPVIHGVGGSFDVMAGIVPRAPLWMQKSGLEWLFRLLQEPRRMWRRYLFTNILFVLLLFREWLRLHFSVVERQRRRREVPRQKEAK